MPKGQKGTFRHGLGNSLRNCITKCEDCRQGSRDYQREYQRRRRGSAPEGPAESRLDDACDVIAEVLGAQ